MWDLICPSNLKSVRTLHFLYWSSEAASALGWHVYGRLCAGLVDPDGLATELGKLLRSQFQAARHRVLVSVLHDAEDVLTGTSWHSATLAHADIDYEATVVSLLEEASSFDLLAER